MKCRLCDTEIPASSTKCPGCHVSLTGLVAEGFLTPPAPDAPTISAMPEAGDDTTVLPRSAPPDPLRDATTVPSSLHRRDLFGDDAPTMMPGERPTGTAPTRRPTATAAQRQPMSHQPSASGDSGPLAIGEPFGPRYHIIRLLGLGGMGAVYQAWDEELGVAVAIKVIRPEVMADPAAARSIERRFKRELLLARQVTHRNVVRIHDLGDIDGIKYITMSYVDGEDLASILKRDGKLPVAKALAFARPVISGLVAAHTAGVVHRDLKPANIMIGKDGEALIMDFGIARSSAAPDTKSDVEETLPAEFRRAAASDVEATKAGSVLGAVRYMAPEQASGEKVDQRADVYAMGLILYDMLLGSRRAELADSALEELKARIEKAPPTVNSVLPEIPAAVDALVSRCLEPDLTKRYQTTKDLEADLNRLDENGEPIPIRKVVGLPLMAAVVVLLLGLAAGTWWYQRQFIPPAEHEPVSVVIADFQNDSGDAAFDGALEPMLRRALEGASFISAFDRQGIRRTLGVQPPERLDEVAAREIAVEHGLGVVLAGSLEPLGSGYSISVRAIQPLTGEVITSAQDTASGRDQVLEAATRLISRVRIALGDETSESAQILAMASLSATSLDVAGLYAAALEASSNNRFEEQRQNLLKAVSLDPAFGIGHQSLAVASRNLGRAEDAETHINEALRYLDGMTERERYNTRGMYFRLTGDYQQCVMQYGELIARYAADVVGRNQLALCLTKLRRLIEAVDEMRSVVQMLPNRALFRVNLSWYASYAGQFQDAEEQARAIQDPDVYATHALAFALLGQGQVDQAMAAYEKLSTFGTLGASMAASGLGDVAAYQGRFSDAVRILEEGAAADLEANYAARAAARFAALAHAHLSQDNRGAAAAAAEQALVHGAAASIRFLAARTFVEAGDTARARREAGPLASELELEPQAYAKIVEGAIALKEGDARQAVGLLREANELFDTWIGHFELGRAYLELGADLQADSEFDDCLRRRGEALSLFLDEEPTYGYFPSVYYYQGRVRENLKTVAFADSYRQYLDIRGDSGEDALVVEVRGRVAS